MENNKQPVEGKRIKVQQVKKASSKLNVRELLAELCYHYPQYTLKEAELIPYRDVELLLRVAHKSQAVLLYNLTQIAAAPHTKKGQGVTKLSEHFKKLSK